MQIDIFATSRRLSVCRRCGRTIEYADTLAHGRRIAFDGPIAARAPSNLFVSDDDDGGRAVDTLDTTINPRHVDTCPARVRMDVGCLVVIPASRYHRYRHGGLK